MSDEPQHDADEHVVQEQRDIPESEILKIEREVPPQPAETDSEKWKPWAG